MTKQLFILVLIIFIKAGHIYGQDSASVKPVNRSTVSLEIGGAGSFASVNYEHLVYYNSYNKLLLRVGATAPYKDFGNNYFELFPIGIYYLNGNKHHLELGLNSSVMYNKGFKLVFISPSIGYRYQKFLSKSMSFSIAISPIIDIEKQENLRVIPWAKIGIGYSFNSKNRTVKPKSNYSDTLNTRKRFFIELGAHFLTGKQHVISKYRNNGNGSSSYYDAIRFPIDTSALYINSLVVNRRVLPSLSTGVYFNNHEFKAEFAYAKNNSLFVYAEDFGKKAYFKSKEYSYLIGYAYTDLLNRIKRLNRLHLYIGANLQFIHKDREFYYDHYSNIGGRNDSETLNSTVTSNHFSFIPDAGIKLNFGRYVYLKSGVRFNTLSYTYGKFSWNYKVISWWSQINTERENEGRFTKLLITGESSYFNVVENVYLKIGFSF